MVTKVSVGTVGEEEGILFGRGKKGGTVKVSTTFSLLLRLVINNKHNYIKKGLL